jgi:hypothetical protein
VKKETFPLKAVKQVVDSYYKCLHTLQLKSVFEFHEAMHDKDHISELILDPESEEEVEGTEYIVTPCLRM